MSFDIAEAVEFNGRKAGKLWTRDQLPPPLATGDFRSDSKEFALAVAGLQTAMGLVVDGKLGPSTLAALRALPRVDEDSTIHDAPDDTEEPTVDESVVARGRINVSNKLILGGQEIDLPNALLDLGISSSNWLHDDERHFEGLPRSGKMEHFVIHESVTTSVTATIRALDGKRKRTGYLFGIHFTLAPDGHIHQHNDPVTDFLVHANQLNETSAGIEVINPYNPKFGGANIWRNVMPGPWWCWKPSGADKVYCKPTRAQMRTIVPFVELLIEHCPDLPREFPTRELSKHKRRISDWDSGAVPGPGILAHRDFSTHCDGRYLLEHVIAKLGE